MSTESGSGSGDLVVPPLPATTPAGGIPRTEALTDALLGGAALPDAPAASKAARARLEQGLASVVACASHPHLVRIGSYHVAQVLAVLWGKGRTALRVPTRPQAFRWSSRAARRPLGLAAVRLALDGRAATPADGVALAMSDPADPLGIGHDGPGSCADWIASLAPPARCMVAAEATAWATRLWTALDWGRLDPRGVAVGGPDRWWRWSGADAGQVAGIALRGRADVRVRVDPADGRGPAHETHLVVLDGHPGVATRHALMLSALVDALSSLRSPRPSTVPSRVVGWWPDAGKAWIVAVNGRTLAVAADAVVVTAGALLDDNASGRGGTPGREGAPRGSGTPGRERAPGGEGSGH
jgi:hypothetical protein